VGLDAVERAVERVGGEVHVRTRAGRGTVFELRLPLALALVPAVLVESGGETYAIDAARIVETGRLESSAIIRDGARVTWRGRELPLVSLEALLGRIGGVEAGDGEAGDARSAPFVIVNLAPAEDAGAPEGRAGAGSERVGVEASGGAGARLAAVAVDRVAGRRDALVRGLGRHATRWRGVGGAIDLHDGSVALLLDLASLIDRARGER
jgi:two-component system chemotaxis sensor kinase CheA